MKEVSAKDLKIGVKYYIQNKNYPIRRCGIFSYNTEPYINKGLISTFTPHCNQNDTFTYLSLHEIHWTYYELTAVHNAWVNAALRAITGDPYFTYCVES